MWKWLLGIFIVCVLGCAGGGFFLATSDFGKSFARKFSGKANATQVRIEKVARGELVRTVNAPGSIEPKTKVIVSAQVSAKIIALPFREGDAVKKGDVIVRLDSVDLAARLESAQAELKADEARLEGARASFENAKAELDRQKELFSSRDVSKSDLDRAEAEYRRADAALRAATFSIEVARANIARAAKDLDNAVITSPMDGRIVKLNSEVGETVLGTFNNAGTSIMEIADLSVMLLRARVDESNIAPVKENQSARIYINAYPGEELRGRVDKVGLKRLIAQDQSGYFEVEILVDKPPERLLRSGLQANTDIEVETLADVIRIPSQAVVDRRVDELPKEAQDANASLGQRKAYARIVYRVIDDPDATDPNTRKAVAVPVITGASDLSHTVIVAGLEEGWGVVTGPYKALVSVKQGDRVIDENDAKKPDKPGEAAPTAAASAKN
ncbi:MAG: efflux RND transporter periplasmic adaptor subunit [Phycisphaeraceae bacterium]|nr:efflux RND transporter periplasmic adaptor subunit [Phycisphaeraceae bacterium]